MPLSDLAVSIDWCTRFFGRPPDALAGDEILWDVDKHATLFIEPSPVQARAGGIAFGVVGLEALVDGLSSRGIGHEPLETYPNGVRQVVIRDPDDNMPAFAEAQDS